MKKQGKMPWGILLVLLLAGTVWLAGCGEETQRAEGSGAASGAEPAEEALTPEMRIKQAFLEAYLSDSGETFTPEDLSVEYVGRFDGYFAVYMNGVLNYTQGEDSETVDGVTFRYPDGQHLLVYSEGDGRLYTLREALDGQVFDADGLRRIYEAHRAAKPWMYEEEEMTEVTDREIIRAYVEAYAPKCRPEALSVARMGVFGGCWAVYVNGPFAFADVITTETVGGLRFVYSTSHKLHIYRDGGIYTLPEAWNAGILSREALAALHDAFPNRDPMMTE